MRLHLEHWGALVAVLFGGVGVATARAADDASFRAAVESITSADLRRHAQVLADDTYEGREAGSRGGRAAGGYLQGLLKSHELKPAGEGGGFFQLFDGNSRNLLALLEGSDPERKSEIILISAHYDHVGYGNARNSYGPTGYIHNGADDNASGVATLLEIVEACTRLAPRPPRSILFALWDGEEKGLLGSKHWLSRPTVPLAQVRLMINMDMVGRLRKNRLEFTGARTAAGLRRLVSRQNIEEPLDLDFTWEIKDNSDHHPFFARGIPILMAHTGLHSDYHRPSDDVERLDIEGMRRTGRLLFSLAVDAANQPALPAFRAAARRESPWTQQSVERPLPALPSRFGVSWSPTDATAPGLKITRVAPGSAAAAAGLRVGDRLLRFADQEVGHSTDLGLLVLAAKSPASATVARDGAEQPLEVSVPLRGQPITIGISWRDDDAEPGSVKLVRVVPGSLAARAGLRVLDRVYSLNGRDFADSREFQKLLAEAPLPQQLLVERSGHLQSIEVGTVAVTQ